MHIIYHMTGRCMQGLSPVCSSSFPAFPFPRCSLSLLPVDRRTRSCFGRPVTRVREQQRAAVWGGGGITRAVCGPTDPHIDRCTGRLGDGRWTTARAPDSPLRRAANTALPTWHPVTSYCVSCRQTEQRMVFVHGGLGAAPRMA